MTPFYSSAVACTAALAVVAGVGIAADRDRGRAFLAATFGLTTGDFTRIDRGEVVAKGTAAGDARDIATFGIVRARITPAFYVERLNDIVSFKKNEAVLQIGVFSRPPVLQDVAALTLDEHDMRSLRDCRPGDCGLQLPAPAIERLRSEVDWSRPDAQERALGVVRQMLVEYVRRYMESGPSAAGMRYADEKKATDVGGEFSSLATSDAGGWGRFPHLRRHLLEYPRPAAAGGRDLIYWSKEVVGRRTVASVTHVAILPGEAPAAFAIGSKQIYATHYFEASLGVTVLVADASTPEPATYVAYLNRSRVDVIGGLFGGVTKKVIASKARGTVDDILNRLRIRLEQQFTDGS